MIDKEDRGKLELQDQESGAPVNEGQQPATSLGEAANKQRQHHCHHKHSNR